MAAGLGFKDFTTGEVLTAADVDGYLMQGVWVFASAAARDAAVTSPQEGNFAYLKDTNVTTYYTGSAWANLDTTGMTNPMTTTGDMVYSSSGSTPARLGIGSTGNVLTVSGGLPVWSAPGGSSPASAQSFVATKQSTSSTSFTGLTTAQSVTLTTGTKVMIALTCQAEPATTGGARAYMGYAVSGATTIAASDGKSSIQGNIVTRTNSPELTQCAVFFETVTAGSNTFTAQFRVDTGSGGFQERQLLVIDLGS
jgi:hypothetical protein